MQKRLLAIFLLIFTTFISSFFVIDSKPTRTRINFNEFESSTQELGFVTDEDLGNGILEYGMYHGMFLVDGQIFGFGNNPNGEIGVPPKTSYGDKTSANTHTELEKVYDNPAEGFYNNNIDQVYPGWEFTLVLRDGVVYSFGGNSQYMLGNPAFDQNEKGYLPRRVPDYDANGDGDYEDKDQGDFKNGQVKVISGQKRHVVVVTDDGYAYGWGHNTNYRKIAYTTEKFIPYPKLFTSLKGFEPGQVDSVKTHYTNTTFYMKNGDVYSQGYNYLGQHGSGKTGSGTSKQNMNKVDTSNLDSKLIQVEKGYDYSIYLTEGGYLYYSGDLDGYSKGKFRKVSKPTLYPDSEDFKNDGSIVKISQGQYHTLLLNNAGEVLSFGSNSSGQLGVGSRVSSYDISYVAETQDFTQGNAQDIKASWDYSFIIDKSGQMIGAGNNSRLQLGIGSSSKDQVEFFRLEIKDTVLPKVTVNQSLVDVDSVNTKHINLGEDLGDLKQYFTIVDENGTNITVQNSHITSNLDTNTAGTYDVVCSYTNILGVTGRATLTVVVLDNGLEITNPGVIEIVPTNERLDGGSWDFNPFLPVEEQIGDIIKPSRELTNGSTTVDVDTSKVDYKTPGVYPVLIEATDSDGNKTTVIVDVEVGRNDAILSNLSTFLPNKQNWWGWLIYLLAMLLLLINDDEEDEEREEKIRKRAEKKEIRKQKAANRRFHIPLPHLPSFLTHTRDKVASVKRTTKNKIKGNKLGGSVITKSRHGIDTFFHHIEEGIIYVSRNILNFFMLPFRLFKKLFRFNSHSTSFKSTKTDKNVSKNSKVKINSHKIGFKTKVDKFSMFNVRRSQYKNRTLLALKHLIYRANRSNNHELAHKLFNIKLSLFKNRKLKHVSLELGEEPYFKLPSFVSGKTSGFMYFNINHINNKYILDVYTSSDFNSDLDLNNITSLEFSNYVLKNTYDYKYKQLHDFELEYNKQLNILSYDSVSNALIDMNKQDVITHSTLNAINLDTKKHIEEKQSQPVRSNLDISTITSSNYNIEFKKANIGDIYYFMIIGALGSELVFESDMKNKLKKKYIKLFDKYRFENIRDKRNYRIIKEGTAKAEFDLVCETLIPANEFYDLNYKTDNVIFVYSNIHSNKEMEYAIVELSLDSKFNEYPDISYEEIVSRTKKFSKHQ